MSDEANPYVSPQAAPLERREVTWVTENAASLQRVRTGLALLYSGVCGLILSTGTVIVTAVVVRENDEALWVAGVVFSIGTLVLSLIGLLGKIFCTSVPAETGAKSLAVGAAVLHGLVYPCIIWTYFLQSNPTLLYGVGVAENLLCAASFVCFTRFMSCVADHIVRPDIVSRAFRTLLVGVASGATLMFSAIWYLRVPEVRLWAAVTILITSVGVFIALLMYANTVTYLRKAITV